MSGGFHSDAWFRVEHVVARLQPSVRIHRQRYRGQPWYVVLDAASGRLHRFMPEAYLIIGLMDGSRTLDQVWRLAVQRLGDAAPSQDEMLDLLSKLHAADLLQANLAPDVAELLQRERKQRRSVWMQNLKSPMSLRLPLWDPDAFLARTLPRLRGLFGPCGMLLWLALVLPACVLAAMHWRELTGNLSDRVLAVDNLLLLLIVFPLVKAAHELAHGYAVKRGGGEVHEMGLMLLVLAPVPYVDASASTGFRSKLARAGVGAAGMLAEMALAALAMFVWLLVEPGLARSLAFNAMLVAGVSTLVFNANPLLRYDGYFIFCDLIEMPNLGQRATQYWGWLVQRYAFGSREAEPPNESVSERRWLLFYGAASWIYRMLVLLAIAAFVADQFFFVGVALAIWSVVSGVVWPVIKGLKFVVAAPVLARRRRRAVAVTGGALAVLLLVAALLPVPMSTYAEGVVWVPEKAELRAGTDGEVRRLLLAPGTRVEPGTPVAEFDDAALWAEYEVQRFRVEQAEAQLASDLAEERANAAVTREALDKERQALDRLEQRLDQLVVSAETPGELVVTRSADLPGRHLRQGEQFGYVLAGALQGARIVVTQDDIDLVRSRLATLRVRVADRIAESHVARIVREVPGGSDRLPSRALSQGGGGRHAVDPSDQEGTRTLTRVFQFEVALPPEVGELRLGTRVYARFEHEPEPLAFQAARRVRQLFLSRFAI